MSAENQGVMHAAFRTLTWGVIPLAALVGGLSVSLLTGPVGVLDAARWTMAGGTILAAFSFVSAIRIQPLLDAAEAASQAAPEPVSEQASELAESAS
jgi:hypothetical protein